MHSQHHCISHFGEDGIHGRHNTEAFGSDINPFEFEIDFTQVVVPNPVSWAVMKLTAMQDFWNQANDRAKDARDRAFGRVQAEKHGQDVCRAIAMTTLDERDETAQVVSAIEATHSYLKAMRIFESAFEEGAWARDLVSGDWSAEDLNVIVTVLANWFPTPSH